MNHRAYNADAPKPGLPRRRVLILGGGFAGAYAARFDPDHPRDPLIAFLDDVLEPQQRVELVRLVDEYWAARIDAELRDAPDRSDAARQRTQQRLVFGLFQQEIRQAYERTLRPFHDKPETIYQAADPTPEQRAAIRTIVIEHIRRSRLNPTPEQRAGRKGVAHGPR